MRPKEALTKFDLALVMFGSLIDLRLNAMACEEPDRHYRESGNSVSSKASCWFPLSPA